MSPADPVRRLRMTADRPLSRQDVRTLALAALGGALEFYDFIIFVFLTAVIAQLFFPPDLPEWLRQLQTFGIFAAGYLARPLGGIVMAHFGDLIGRKRMFMLSVLLMAVPTLLMGLLPTYADIGIAAPIALLLLRVLQGAAVGGEVPGAWVFVSEHVPARRIGFACGTLTAGLTFGILLGSLVASTVNTTWTQQEVLDWAWRVPFVLGGVFGLFAMYLRRWLHETPVFEQLRRQRELVEGMPLRHVLRGHAGAVASAMLLTWMLTAGVVVVILLTPTLIQKAFAISAPDALRANSLATLTLTIGCIVFGLVADRIGAALTTALGGVLMALTALALYAGLAHAPQHFVWLYALAGFCVGVVGVVPTVIVGLFPAAIRFSGLSFSYNVAYALSGGLTPMIVTLWMQKLPLAPAAYVAVVSAIGVATATTLLMRARRNTFATA